MSDASSAPEVVSEEAATAPPVAPAPVVLPHPRPPRPGELTLGWRAITAGLWVGVIIGLAAVWNASVQLGLTTWWLGPRGEPQSRIVQFSPFVAPVLMLLGTINQLRWLGWAGLVAAATIAGFAVGDIGRVSGLAVVEFAIAGAAAVVSIASFTGTYRSGGTESAGPSEAPAS